MNVQNLFVSVLFATTVLNASLSSGENINEGRITELEKRVEELEKRLAEGQRGESQWLADLQSSAIARGLDFGFLLEFEAAYLDEKKAKAKSSLDLATFEFYATADITEDFTTEAVLLWEEDELDLDVAVVKLANLLDKPLMLNIGKMYVPFGEFYTEMVSDPLTLDFAETNRPALQVSLQNQIVHPSLTVFSGKVRNEDIDNYVLRMDVSPCGWFHAGAFYISDLRETDCLRELIDSTGVDGHRTAGGGMFACANMQKLTLSGEYIQTIDRFARGSLEPSARKLRPRTWMVEASTPVFDTLTLAARYEYAQNLPDFADERYGAAIAWNLKEHLTLSSELLRSNLDAGMATQATIQLAVEF